MREHRAEIAAVNHAAARFAFDKMIGFAALRMADALADELTARDHRVSACSCALERRVFGQRATR
jgi:hypothetical protein